MPPWGTIYRWFAAFRDDGRFEKINHALVMADRERTGREASPSGAIIDSQSVKTTEAGGPRGYDAGKKVKGRKRHALVDTDGRGLLLEPHPASIQDRHGGGALLCASRGLFPFIEKVFADSGYAGDKVATATVTQSGVQRLWNDGATGMAANDDGQAPPQGRLEAQFGYGFGVFGGTGVLTPYSGLSLAGEGAGRYTLGTRLEIAPSLNLSLEGTRREAANDDADHGVMLQGQLRF